MTLNPDIEKLRLEQYDVHLEDNLIVVRNVPYLGAGDKVKYDGILLSIVEKQSNGMVVMPSGGYSHVAYLCGEEPYCFNTKRPLTMINRGVPPISSTNYQSNYGFSNKPNSGFKDLYEKMSHYYALLEREALCVDPKANARDCTEVLPDIENESVFCYCDTASIRMGINMEMSMFDKHKIGIIGIGGTGSYVLDFVAKHPVAEIHIFDEDIFEKHNAFRAPGAAGIEEFDTKQRKVEYFQRIYSKFHKNIIAHSHKITTETLDLLAEMDFVFICVDDSSIKKPIGEYLKAKGKAFVDVGIGLIKTPQNQIEGHVRTTFSDFENRKSFEDAHGSNPAPKAEENVYHSAIQLVELNALNAAFAVIFWKKHFGFYRKACPRHEVLLEIASWGIVDEKTQETQQ